MTEKQMSFTINYDTYYCNRDCPQLFLGDYNYCCKVFEGSTPMVNGKILRRAECINMEKILGEDLTQGSGEA